MKKAFTILELVFVITVIGILSVVVAPRFGTTNLKDAATQVVSHIRYTQHLAMSNDKYDPLDVASNNSWFERRWRIAFSKSVNTKNHYAYTIFDDRLSNASGNPDRNEVAVNPVDKNKKLTGGDAGATMIHTGDPDATDEMNIGLEYGILDVSFSPNCRTASNSKTITFDHLGRPIRGATSSMSTAYDSSTTETNNLISQRCQINLCTASSCATASSDEMISIIIEPETGYTCVLGSDGNCTGV